MGERFIPEEAIATDKRDIETNKRLRVTNDYNYNAIMYLAYQDELENSPDGREREYIQQKVEEYRSKFEGTFESMKELGFNNAGMVISSVSLEPEKDTHRTYGNGDFETTQLNEIEESVLLQSKILKEYNGHAMHEYYERLCAVVDLNNGYFGDTRSEELKRLYEYYSDFLTPDELRAAERVAGWEKRTNIMEDRGTVTSRPTEDDFSSKLESLNQMTVSAQKRRVRMELEDFAQGEGDESVRDEYYPGWLDKDFEKLIELWDKSNK